jgi:hypothetical protein
MAVAIAVSRRYANFGAAKIRPIACSAIKAHHSKTAIH